jgi:hypothetical protein
VRANRIIQELRFETQLAGSDSFKINDHASGMFVRVYKLQRPHADVEIQKKGHWKAITQTDRERVLAAVTALKRAGRI